MTVLRFPWTLSGEHRDLAANGARRGLPTRQPDTTAESAAAARPSWRQEPNSTPSESSSDDSAARNSVARGWTRVSRNCARRKPLPPRPLSFILLHRVSLRSNAPFHPAQTFAPQQPRRLYPFCASSHIVSHDVLHQPTMKQRHLSSPTAHASPINHPRQQRSDTSLRPPPLRPRSHTLSFQHGVSAAPFSKNGGQSHGNTHSQPSLRARAGARHFPRSSKGSAAARRSRRRPSTGTLLFPTLFGRGRGGRGTG